MGAEVEDGDGADTSLSWQIEIQAMAVDERQKHRQVRLRAWAASMYVSMCPRAM
jgi:hypothetical protein